MPLETDAPNSPKSSVPQGFAGLARLFPHVSDGATTPAKALEQRVEPPTRSPVARSAFVAPSSYVLPSSFQVPTAFASPHAAAALNARAPGVPAMPAPVAEVTPKRPPAAPTPVAAPVPPPPPPLPPPPPSPAAPPAVQVLPPVSVMSPVAPLFAPVLAAMPSAAAPPDLLPPVMASAPPAVTSPAMPPLLPGVQLSVPVAAPSPMAPPVAVPVPMAPAFASLPPPPWPPAPPPLSPVTGEARLPGFRPKSSGASVWLWLIGSLVLIASLAFGLVQWFAHYDRTGARTEVAGLKISTENVPTVVTPTPAPAPAPAAPPPDVAAAPPPPEVTAPAPAPALPPVAETPAPAPPPATSPPPVERPPEPQRAADLPRELKPPVGEGRLFGAGQIRYCVAQNMRLSVQNKLVRSESTPEVNRYNDLLGDYNLRCRNFKYERGELQRVLAALEADRPQIEAQARVEWQVQRKDVLEDVPEVQPARPPAGTPRPRRVEPAERPLWWCLPGPENKCVPM